MNKKPNGSLIVNADDWGRDRRTTDRTLDCVLRGTVSSVSAMVFMVDSERAAALALEKNVDAGLHLNFTTQFSAPGTPAHLAEHQRAITKYLRSHRLAQVLFHPGLTNSFRHVVGAQIDEFSRLYGKRADRIDGHHHMHLSANVIMQRLLPAGTVVRRNFSFHNGEKGLTNRLYRRVIDQALARRHRLCDGLYSLPPLEPPDRLNGIFALARHLVVEVETHPVNEEEYRFLMGEEIIKRAANVSIAGRFTALGTQN